MKIKLAYILQNIALGLLILAIPGQFVFNSEMFDIFYAVASSAGICLILISFAIFRGDWGVVPVAVIFGCISIYFMVDFSIFDEFVKTKKAGIIIITLSAICWLISLIRQLWRK